MTDAEPMISGATTPDEFLAPTRYVDSDHPDVVAYARNAVGEAGSPRERAVALFYAVRDGIRYDPYSVVFDPDAFKASAITRQKRAFCIPKAVLLTGSARAMGIPARLGFVDVINHLSSEKLLRMLGTDLFVFHGYSELYLDGAWLKVTPAFNVELCRAFKLSPLEFDGTADAMFQEFDAGERRYMEYVRHRGTFADLPYDEMVTAFVETYGKRLQAQQDLDDKAFQGE